MLHELQRDQLRTIEPLLDGERVNMEVKAIAAGNNPGSVFVDDREKPRSALVFSHGQRGFYFTGRENNRRFEAALPQTIASLRPRLARLGITYEVYYFKFEAIEEDATDQ